MINFAQAHGDYLDPDKDNSDPVMSPKVKSAYGYLISHPQSGPFCWCGHAKGHSIENCRDCGQPYSTDQKTISKGDLLMRWLRRPGNKRTLEDILRQQCNEWRYLNCRNYGDKQEWDSFKFEDFEKAFQIWEQA